MNKVILMGRLTHEPELRQTPTGLSVVSFGIAVNRRFAKDGQQTADFINCTAWRQTAEFVCKYFRKGSMISLVGSLQSRSWEDNNGNKRSTVEVQVDEVYFTGEKASQGVVPGGFEGQTQQRRPQTRQTESYSMPNETTGFDDFDAMGFSAVDDSEDDLPF